MALSLQYSYSVSLLLSGQAVDALLVLMYNEQGNRQRKEFEFCPGGAHKSSRLLRRSSNAVHIRQLENMGQEKTYSDYIKGIANRVESLDGFMLVIGLVQSHCPFGSGWNTGSSSAGEGVSEALGQGLLRGI